MITVPLMRVKVPPIQRRCDWCERNSKLYDGPTAEILKKQKSKCSYCGLKFQTKLMKKFISIILMEIIITGNEIT
jgi:hypothetical protein